ncbi:hypothetical protein L596_019477 [Steinernema carpocapsae]|uniref:Uncharacterized protein n=1 Tax=Steinernema carpocapsae TaxID=34508 RepID=A0A4U5MQM6_STECR|nr:hypothetical protein L596_019477 [Steinernema carpocapsae]
MADEMRPPVDLRPLFENFEEVGPLECKITGHLPLWLSGTLLRNGPGTFKIGDSDYHHWFDGLAYIRKYHFENGKMTYTAKHLKSDSYKLNHAANRIVVGEFGTAAYPDPCKNIFQRFFSFFEEKKFTDNGLVNFVQCGDRIFATTETPFMTEVDLETVDTKERLNLSDYVALNTVTAHQHYDADGNIFNIGSKFGKGGEYVIAKTENTKTEAFKLTNKIASIPMNNSLHPSYYHSFGMTQNYLILFECPLTMNVWKIMVAKLRGQSFLHTMEWNPSNPVNVHIVNRETGEPLEVKIKSPAFFTFHHANSYENGDFLVLDYCKVRDGNVVKGFTLNQMREGSIKTTNPDQMAILHRMVVPLKLSEVKDNKKNLLENIDFAQGCKAFYKEDGCLWVEDAELCEIPMELPRYNYAYNMKCYKYVYGTVLQQEDYTGILKVNVANRTHQMWRNDNSEQISAEPVFVANPNGVDEDDGVLLCP